MIFLLNGLSIANIATKSFFYIYIYIMKYIVGCDNLHDSMCKLVDESEKFIYITSFELDIEFNNGVLFNKLSNALQRDIHIFIMTCGLCVTDVNYNLLIKLKTKFPKLLHLKLNHMREQDKEFIEPLFEKLFDFLAHSKLVSDHDYYAKLQGKTATGLHLRYVGNEKKMLICGGNYSPKYSGSIYDNNRHRGQYKYAWIETGLLLQGDFKKTMKLMFADKYSCVKYPFISSGLDHYHYIIYRIHKAKKSIYFENQYFFTHKIYTQNKIWYAVARRIIRAIRNNKEFNFTIKINWDCKDETAMRYEGSAFLIRQSVLDMILYIKELTDASDETINKYISIWTSAKSAKLVFHSKIFMFDDKHCLITSANIYDACFYSKGHQELGYIVENNTKFCDKIRKSISDDLLRRLQLTDIYKIEMQFPYNQCNSVIQTLRVKWMLFSPIHYEIDAFSVLCDTTPYKCDYVNYNDLKKRPIFLLQ